MKTSTYNLLLKLYKNFGSNQFTSNDITALGIDGFGIGNLKRMSYIKIVGCKNDNVNSKRLNNIYIISDTAISYVINKYNGYYLNERGNKVIML